MSRSIWKSERWRPSRTWAASICAIVFVAASAGWFFWHRQATREVTTTADTGYVDSQTCATCHADVAETYKKTGMGRTFHKPSQQTVIEDFSKANRFLHKASGLQYTMIDRDGKIYQRRSAVGFDGKETDVLEEQVDYVIGSGNHGRAYLHRTAQGKLVQLPISWYVEKGGYWNMSPGFDRPDQPDMHGTVAPECIFCHTAYPLSTNGATPGADQVFPATLPEGIDCQRCHGPGAAHVATARSGKASDQEIRNKIVNPARLSREHQLEVCMECHLETSAHHVPSAIRAYGRDINSFRPGEALGDYKLYFERPKSPKGEDFEMAHAAYQLPRSDCFRNSKMTCLTCHDPHNIPRGEEARQQYIGVCEGCHKAVPHKGVAMKAGSDCLSCHMPKRRPEGSVHIVLTDHRIQRYPPPGDLRAPIPEKVPQLDRTPVEIYYPKSAPQPSAALYLAVAQVNDEGIDGIGNLRTILQREHPKWPEPYVALGHAYVRVGRSDDALRSFRDALDRKPDDRDALDATVTTLLGTNQLDQAVSVLQRALQLYPTDDRFWANLGNTYLRQGRISDAQDALSRAVSANPEHAEARNLLGLCAVQRGDKQQAEQNFRESIRLQPLLPEPHNNLANLLTGEHTYPEAEFHFRRAIELNPEYADAHHGLGLLLILTHHEAEAGSELEAAAKGAPNNAQIRTDLGDLLSAQGKMSEAAEEYRRSLQLNASQPDTNLALAMILLQQGQRDAAVPYLMRAAAGADPEVSQHAQSILAQIQR